MATASTQEHAVLVGHLVDLVERRLVDPLELILASAAPVADLRAGLRTEAEVWAAQLLGRDQSLATSTACRLLAALYPSDGPFEAPPGWWQSPLGRVVARRVGHPGAERVSAAEAGTMLGITRQGVHDLLARNKLDRHPVGGVSTASIRERLAARA